MKIIHLEISGRGIDRPRSFPSAVSPTLKTAPDLRINTEENDEDLKVSQINNARLNIKIPRLV